jgi:hypothetical protein
MSSGKTSAMLLAASALFASAARGQDASTGAAIALFDEGVKLMEEGKYSGACPRLARSQQLAPSGGTLLALAECYEKNGQFASAWIAYKEVSARARTAGKLDAERRATELTQKIEPRVAWLTINVSGTPGGAPPTVTRDGQPVPSAEWSVAVPIDPGPHSIQATAPGRRPFAREIVVPTRGERTTIDVPPLDPLPENGAPTSPVAPPSSEGGTQRTIGIVLGGAGVVGLAVGTIFGLSAMSKNDEAASRCRTETPRGFGSTPRDATQRPSRRSRSWSASPPSAAVSRSISPRPNRARPRTRSWCVRPVSAPFWAGRFESADGTAFGLSANRRQRQQRVLMPSSARSPDVSVESTSTSHRLPPPPPTSASKRYDGYPPSGASRHVVVSGV